MSEDEYERNRGVRDLTELFLRTTIEAQRSDPSPVVLGPVGYIAKWTADDRTRFLHGFAEALTASLTSNDPRPCRSFIKLMMHASDRSTNPTVTGEMSADAEEWVGRQLGGTDGANAGPKHRRAGRGVTG